MTYAPPIMKRQYINPKKVGVAITHHACSQCRLEHPIRARGVWFESALRRDVWFWVCEACLDLKRRK
jgi:hypothetical protein